MSNFAFLVQFTKLITTHHIEWNNIWFTYLKGRYKEWEISFADEQTKRESKLRTDGVCKQKI